MGSGRWRVSGTFLFSGESPRTDCTCHPERPQGVEGSSHRFGCGGFVSAKILRRASLAQDDTPRLKQKGGIPAETPQHYHHTTLSNNCQLSVWEKLRILCFTPKFRKLFVLFPVLRNALKYGRLMVRKKVIPDMVSTPAGWAFKIFRFT